MGKLTPGQLRDLASLVEEAVLGLIPNPLVDKLREEAARREGEAPRRSAAHVPPFDWDAMQREPDPGPPHKNYTNHSAATPPAADAFKTAKAEALIQTLCCLLDADRNAETIRNVRAEALQKRVAELEAALRAIAWSNDSKWQQDAAKLALAGAANG